MTDATIRQAETSGISEARVADYFALMKPRVMSLAIFTSIAGMAAATAEIHPIIALAAILCISLGAGASGALNMWWEADIDAQMGRTQRRPIPAGLVTRDEALAIGVFFAIVSVMMLSVFANPLAGLLLGGTIAFYAGFYTMWLKRRTPQNIVIGGAAGAMPPVIGWAVATGSVTIEPVLMFAALWKRREYEQAAVPMLPVTAGPRVTRIQILAYSILLAACGIALIFTSASGPIYAAVALIANPLFVLRAWQVWRRDEDAAIAERYAAEKKLFAFSLTYLAIVFAAFVADAVLSSVLEAFA